MLSDHRCFMQEWHGRRPDRCCRSARGRRVFQQVGGNVSRRCASRDQPEVPVSSGRGKIAIDSLQRRDRQAVHLRTSSSTPCPGHGAAVAPLRAGGKGISSTTGTFSRAQRKSCSRFAAALTTVQAYHRSLKHACEQAARMICMRTLVHAAISWMTEMAYNRSAGKHHQGLSEIAAAARR